MDAVAGHYHARHPAASPVCLRLAGVPFCDTGHYPSTVPRLSQNTSRALCCVAGGAKPEGLHVLLLYLNLGFSPEFVGRIKLLEGVAQLLGESSVRLV